MATRKIWIDPQLLLRTAMTGTTGYGGMGCFVAVVGVALMSVVQGRDDGQVPAADAAIDDLARILHADADDVQGEFEGWTEKDHLNGGLKAAIANGLIVDENGVLRIGVWGTLIGAMNERKELAPSTPSSHTRLS